MMRLKKFFLVNSMNHSYIISTFKRILELSSKYTSNFAVDSKPKIA